MKKTALVVMAAVMVSAAVPAFAQQESNQDRVICQLASKNCLTESEAIQKRVRKLKKEIDKGKSYPAEDVQKLEQKLKEAQEILDRLEGKKPAK